jgi:putative MFS transporter
MAIGCLISGITGDLYGRRKTYMYNLALFTFGALIAALAPNITVLYIARLIVGIGLGGELNTGVTMVSEFVPTRNRGSSTAVVNIAAGGLGTFLSAGIAFLMLGPLLDLFGGKTLAWRWMFGLLVVPALLLFFYRLYIPESPRYLLFRGKVEEANWVLSMLKNRTLRRKNVSYEPILHFDQANFTGPREKVDFREIFSRGLASQTICIWITAWMAVGTEIGITVFLPTVLKSEGFNVVSSIMYAMIINAGGLVGAVLASVLAPRVGRRVVLGVGALVAVVLSVPFGLSRSVWLILVIGAALQIVFMLLNTTVWIVGPELYPTRVRAFGTGAVVLVCQVSGATMPYVFGKIFGAWGSIGLYSLVAMMFGIMAITVWTLLKETRGKSLEEISGITLAEPAKA